MREHSERASQDPGAFIRKLQGLLLFRLLMAVFFLVLTLGVQSRREEELLAVELWPLYYFSCILFLFTIVAGLSLKRVRRLRQFTYLQLLFDVGAVTALIYLSGGVESLFSFLYTPVIISAAVLLYRRASLLIASVCSLAYGLLLDLQYFGWLAPLHIVSNQASSRDSATYFLGILMNIAGFYVVAFLSGYLAEELQRSSLQARKHKRDLRQLEVLHLNIVQSISSGLLTIGPAGSVIFSNGAAQSILGRSSEQIEGCPLHTILPSLDISPSVDSPLVLSESTNERFERKEIKYERPDGEELCLGYNISVLQNRSSEFSGWVFVFQDLTRLKALEGHMQRMERMAFAGKIAAEIAHDIKNPLAAISGAFQMLKMEATEEGLQGRLLNIVDREVDRIDELVTNFLWLARGAKSPEKIQEVPLCSAIEEVLAMLKVRGTLTPAHAVQLSCHGAPILIMDRHHLNQILWALVTNACEAMPAGGELMITASGWDAERLEEVRIDIRDTGCGVSEEVRGRMFEPFFTTKEGGTGLGLSIAYQLVENTGGRIDVTSHPDAGTTVSLFFPPPSLNSCQAGAK